MKWIFKEDETRKAYKSKRNEKNHTLAGTMGKR